MKESQTSNHFPGKLEWVFLGTLSLLALSSHVPTTRSPEIAPIPAPVVLPTVTPTETPLPFLGVAKRLRCSDITVNGKRECH